MNRLRSFFIGILLLAIVVAGVFFVVLTYRADEQTHIESYIFQMDNNVQSRVGPLQDIKDIPEQELRDKLIQKYVAEYFKVIPGGITTEQQNIIQDLSKKDVYKKWSGGEAKTIETMSQNKMFRNVWVNPEYIRILPLEESGWYEIPYVMRTWAESNNMNSEITDESGTLFLRIRFEKGLQPDIDVRKHFKEGKNPATLFKFKVLDIR